LPTIWAETWDKMTTTDILHSIEISLRVLAKRILKDSDKDYVVELIKDLLTLISPIKKKVK